MTPRRKLPKSPLPQKTESRPLSAASETRSTLGTVLARARALGMYAAVTIAPLGLAGSVSACGAARPVEHTPHYQPGQPVPPVETIAPPPAAAPSSSAPVPAQSE